MRRSRRNKKEKLQKAMVEVILGIVVALTLIFTFNTYYEARYEWEEVYPTMYYSYRIAFGDTVEDIAQVVNKYNDNMNYEQTMLEIGRLNNICIDEIKGGDYLLLPYTNEEFLEVIE
jgi:hypothetical protein